jgi:mannose-6-phosphate isomerase-like protein (cupin superfamily)
MSSSRQSLGNVRIVATGHEATGQGTIVRDELVGPAHAADQWQSHLLWGIDELPTFPDGGDTAWTALMPPKGALRLAQMIVYPDEGGAVEKQLDDDSTGINRVEGASPGMHFTPSLDILIVIEGEVVLETDGGKEVVLRPGDSVVQNGTRHAWHNRTSSPARVGVVVVGTDHRGY